MTKSELRSMIREMLQEELDNLQTESLVESAEGPTYIIKAWERPGKQGKMIDTSKTNEKYPDFDDVLKALQTKYSGLSDYEITWLPSGQSVE